MRRLLLGLGWLLTLAPAWAAPLSLESAVQAALAHNPELQATLKDVGVAQADQHRAGHIDNPELGATVRFPNESGYATNSDFSLTVNLQSLSLRPLRQRLADLGLQQAQTRVAQAMLDLKVQVEQSWYRLAGDQAGLVLQETVATASQGAAELAQQQFQAGNINDIDLNRQVASAAQDRLELKRLQQAITMDQQRLQQLTTLSDTPTVGDLPALPAQDPDEATLETQAVQHRNDLQAARLAEAQEQQTVTLRQREAGWGQVRAGIDGGQEIEGVTVIGPTLQWTLPIFNTGDVEKAQVQAEQSHLQVTATEREVRAQVQTAWQQMQTARQQVELYDGVILPARRKIVAQGQLHYNDMLLSVYQLLDDRQALSQAQQQSVQARTDYWIAHSELERAVGGTP